MKAIFSAIIIVSIIAYLTLVMFGGYTLEKEPDVDPRLAQWVSEWKRDMENAGIDYRVGFSRIAKIRICEECRAGYSDRGDREIAVSREQLNAGPNSARGTIYHELGHAVFNLQHGSCNIMRRESWTEPEYSENWTFFIDEYINKCKNNWYEAKF
jgi:hypothetical protein